MLTITPITFLLTTLAVTASAVEGSLLWGALPFLLAFFNEGLRIWAATPDEEEE